MKKNLVLAIMLGSFGCGEAPVPVVDPSKATDTAQENADIATIKAALQPIADTGQVSHSGLYGLDKALAKAGKEELVSELNKLGAAKDEASAKKIAKGIIDKL